eukprot:361217-Chlamydomonas_euryale.AAC.6
MPPAAVQVLSKACTGMWSGQCSWSVLLHSSSVALLAAALGRPAGVTHAAACWQWQLEPETDCMHEDSGEAVQAAQPER